MAPLATEPANTGLNLSEGLVEAIAAAAPAIVAVDARQRKTSSGIQWQPGVIVTSNETIRREEDITVTLADGRSLPATLVGRDAGTDLSILTIQESDVTAVEITDPSSLKVGYLVMAIARSGEGNVTASLGVINALGGPWRSWHGGRIDQFIRPDLTLYPGSAGGALINLQGQILGMNTAGPKGTVLTIPAPTISRVVTQLLQGGRIARGYLGLGMQPVQLPDRLVTTLNLTTPTGVMVVSVEPEAPADQAGVMMGDILLTLGDRPLSDMGDVHAMLDADNIGKAVMLRLVRGGALLELTLTIGERQHKPEE